MSRHPTRHPDAEEGAKDDEYDDAAKEHPRIEPGQDAEAEADGTADQQRPTKETASPYEGRNRDHDLIVLDRSGAQSRLSSGL
jgi:hypothetical protein